MLKWSPANAKLRALNNVPNLASYLANKRRVYSLDLLSGWSCPFADKCMAKVVDTDGKRTIKDGKNMVFRCFSASQEALLPLVYNARKHNYDLLKRAKTIEKMTDLLQDSLPANAGIVRIHVAGDFFSEAYFLAWVEVAKANPSVLFYAYTKSLKFWVDNSANIPSNLILTASYGGRSDDMIATHRLRYVKVVLTESAAGDLPIDHDDSHAADPTTRGESFALLIHGVQPAGSEASKAVKALKGKGSYNRKRGAK